MKCYDCVRKDYCTYIHHFNHDLNSGCTDFQERDYSSNTLSTTALDRLNNHNLPCANCKELKVLKIIIEKNVQIGALKFWSKTYKGKLTYQDYLGILEDCELGGKLTEEEFELVMDVILCIN